MTVPPPTGSDQRTGPLPKSRSAWWALAFILVLALLGYAYYAARVRGHDVVPTDVQSGRGLPAPTGPPSTQP